MFETLVRDAAGARGATAIGAWARVENAAAARRLAAMAEVLAAKLADKDSAEREQWCLDNWDAVSAEVAAAQQVSPGVASGQLLDAWGLRERLPRVAEVFATGEISYRLVKSVLTRTRLVFDRDAMAKIDVEIASQIRTWGARSVAKQEAAADSLVDRYDPAAVVRAEGAARSRHVDVTAANDGSGVCFIDAVLYAHEGEVLDHRLDEMARGVCGADPRTLDQRRAAALGAMAAGAERLSCLCENQECPASQHIPNAVVIHVIADKASLGDDTPVTLNGRRPRRDHPPTGTGSGRRTADSRADAGAPPDSNPQLDNVSRHILAPPPATGPAHTGPAAIVGGPLIPAPLLAHAVGGGATIRWLVHPGDAPPEPRYAPSAKLAEFVRCRDMTCRFPGCDVSAFACDIDHTIAYPVGPTQASNLKCLCRKHHLLKTFWGWRDVQHPDGTVEWTSPCGPTFTTHAGSMTLFPALCRPTAAVVTPRIEAPTLRPSGLGMPRRTRTRSQSRAQRRADERRRNEAALGPRDDDGPFGPGSYGS